ncbi:MAG: hypothetical protein PF542_00725 [Nanoarchaeota archaeon]|jgi:sugar-specific transcriptional regulator TrmB|nr:hypothetical protein [Nanoarchaeota archaeon]
MDKLISVLIEHGFEERSAKIYLYLLKNDDSTALEISKGVNIDRTTVYDLLEKLFSKGLVSSLQMNGSRRFRALGAEKLLVHFKEKYDSLEGILPDLKNLELETVDKVSCEFFIGRDGLKIVLKDLINCGKDYKVIGIRKEYEELLGYFNEQGIIKLENFNVKEIAILEKGSNVKKVKGGKYRYLDKKLMSPITTLIYGDYVIFIIWNEPYYSVRIKSDSFVNGQLEYFDLLWGIAKR